MKKGEDKHINEFTNEFDELVAKGKMNINSLEQLMVDNIENYKKNLHKHVEKILLTHIDEKELIIKKNENGKKEDIN